MCVATSIAIATVAAPAAASIYGAHKVSSGNKEAAKLQSQAADRAAELQSKGSADALSFAKQQAQNDWQSSETNRRANYDQWAARERRLGTLGDMLGEGPRDIPGYVASPNPYLNGGGGPTGPGGAPQQGGPPGAPGSVDASKGDIGSQVSAYFKSRGVSDAETPYWVQKWGEFGAKDPAYFNSRLADADIFRGGKPASSGAPAGGQAPPSPFGTVATLLTSPKRQPMTAALQMPGQFGEG